MHSSFYPLFLPIELKQWLFPGPFRPPRRRCSPHPPLSLQLDQINLCIFYMGEKRRRECTFFGREATSADYIVRLSECIYRSSEHLFQVPFEFDVYIYIPFPPLSPLYHHHQHSAFHLMNKIYIIKKIVSARIY